MKTLMIHEIRPWMLRLDLSAFDVITFDDGLYSQYVHYKDFLKFKKPLIFFISSGIICDEDVEQNQEFPTCSESHNSFFVNRDASNYMKWSQIKEMNSVDGVEIGGHGYLHNRLKHMKIKEMYSFLLQDTTDMMTVFHKQDIDISSFCFPYNEEYMFYRSILTEVGVNNFFGGERIDIETQYKYN